MWKPNFRFGYVFGAIYLSALCLALVVYLHDWRWWGVAFLIHVFLFSFGVSFGLHKAAAHRMAPLELPIVRLAMFVGVLANVGSPIDFVITHRAHHRFADGDLDPQNARRLKWKLLFGMRLDFHGDEPVVDLFENREILRLPYFLWLHRNYYLIMGTFLLLTFLAGGVPGLLFIGLIPSGLSFFGLGALNYWGHSGREAKNVGWLFPWILGENWHAHHHASPGLTNYAQAFWQIDVSAVYFLLVRGNK